MKYYKIYLSLLIVMFAFSCRKEIEIDLPEVEIKPVVNCLFSPGEPFKVYVGLTKTPTDTLTYNVGNASVKISDNYQTVEFQHTGNGNYSNINLVPQEGIEYTIKVSIPGFNEAIASNKIPVSGTKILSVVSSSGYKTEPVMGTGEEARIPVQHLKFSIYNDFETADYMGITIVQNLVSYHFIGDSLFIEEKEGEYSLGYLGSNDPVITTEGLENYNPSILLFKDELFQTQPANVELYFEKHSKSRFWARFFLFSPDAFNYTKSWIIHDYTKDYDFWEIYEPLPLFSNIENGYGIFAGYSSTLYEMYPDSTQTFK